MCRELLPLPEKSFHLRTHYYPTGNFLSLLDLALPALPQGEGLGPNRGDPRAPSFLLPQRLLPPPTGSHILLARGPLAPGHVIWRHQFHSCSNPCPVATCNLVLQHKARRLFSLAQSYLKGRRVVGSSPRGHCVVTAWSPRELWKSSDGRIVTEQSKSRSSHVTDHSFSMLSYPCHLMKNV